MAATNAADIQVLRMELNQLKLNHQMAMTQLARGMKELTDLLVEKGVAGKNDIQSLAGLNIFMTMNHQQNEW
jgi:uncharacterized protein YggE